MTKNGFSVPKHFIIFYRMFGVALILLSITRFVFFFANYSSFEQWTINDFLVGVWFDMISVALLSLPLFLWIMIPLPASVRNAKWHKFIRKFLYLFLTVPLLIFNLLDVEYFKFTSKRSTVDLFTIIGAGNDINQLALTFLKDFWFLIILFIVLFVATIWVYNKFFKVVVYDKTNYLRDSLLFLTTLILLVILGRGGVGLRPTGILSAAQYTTMQKTALVLNTPFTMLKSYGKPSLLKKEYYSEDEAEKLYSTNYHFQNKKALPANTNVVVVILESFGKEWVGSKYTPFLDSLIGESVYMSNAFANGRKSIEAMPSIFAGIPSWSDNPYISSPYGDNAIETMVSTLGKHGYSSAFYHGATNGSMRFDDFSSLAGFDEYYGRNEYPNPAHFDGTWGILDEYFNPWAAKKMSELKAPFVAGIFTLSSHHPYYIPEEYQDQIPKSDYPMARSVGYGDISLRKFFDSAKEQDWYENTLFVILADHTPAGSSSFYKHRIGMYGIPIVFFHPQGLIGKGNHKDLVDQIDVYPSVMDLLGLEDEIYAFGQSYLDTNSAEAMYYLEGSYSYLKGDYMLSFSQDKAKALYNFKLDSMAAFDSLKYYPVLVEEMTEALKARIQVYNNDLLSNQMIIEE